MLRAEIISIGDELASGQRLDTNSQWLSQRLGELGVPVVCHCTVADDLATNVEVFRQAVERANIVISTGGLGPTADDLTREALAGLTGQDLVLDETALAYIKSLFARRKRDMPERNVVQAMFPRGSRVIHNPEGTAPGIAVDVPRADGATSHVFALPGVPAEMKQMWEQTVVGALVALGAGRQIIRHRRVKCFGVGESDLEQMLPDLIRRGREPSVGITVHDATITLRVTAAAPTAEACLSAMAPTMQTIRDCLGSLVFGEEDDELEHAVIRLLAERGQTLATCEWGTAGLIADWFGDVPEAAGCHIGDLVTSSKETLLRVLGVDAAILAEHPPGTVEATRATAVACRERFGSDYALAVGPFPGSDVGGSEPGEFRFALATPSGVTVKSSPFAGHSSILKPRAAKQALNLLRLALLH